MKKISRRSFLAAAGVSAAAEKARFRAAVEPMYAAFEEQSRLIQRIREA